LLYIWYASAGRQIIDESDNWIRSKIPACNPVGGWCIVNASVHLVGGVPGERIYYIECTSRVLPGYERNQVTIRLIRLFLKKEGVNSYNKILKTLKMILSLSFSV